MKVSLVFVPPGGGEADYQLEFELPSVPQAGDYISVIRDGATSPGYETFLVRRTIWELKYPKSSSGLATNGEHGTVSTIWVECEFARGMMMTPEHEKACATYAARGYAVPKLDETAY